MNVVRILVFWVLCRRARRARGRPAAIVDDHHNSIGISRKGKDYALKIVLEKEKNEDEKRK